MSVNKVFLMGRIGQDPELRDAGSKKVCELRVATSFKPKDGDEKTTWHTVIAWGRRGEVIAQYFGKGDMIFVEGRIDNRTYDKKDGTKGYASDVIVDSFSFTGGKRDKQNETPDNNQDGDLPF